MKKITPKQQRVYSFYEWFITSFNRLPTYAEAARELNISPSVVFNHVKKLQNLWLIDIQWRTEDMIFKKEAVKIPMLWIVACGDPIEILEDVSEYVDVPTSMIKKSSTYYILRAKGDSMIDVWITSGDLLLIRSQVNVDNWEIWVVVCKNIGDERATLKRVYHKPEGLMLKAANSSFPSIYIKDCEVRWKLVGVIRKYE